MWAAFVVFPMKRAQWFVLIIVFPRPAIAVLHTLQFSGKDLVKIQWPKHVSEPGLLVYLTPGFQSTCTGELLEPLLTSGAQKHDRKGKSVPFYVHLFSFNG